MVAGVRRDGQPLDEGGLVLRAWDQFSVWDTLKRTQHRGEKDTGALQKQTHTKEVGSRRWFSIVLSVLQNTHRQEEQGRTKANRNI